MTRLSYAEWELDVILRLYPDMTAICSALPARTRSGVLQKARQLSLGRLRPKDWTLTELKVVKKLYPNLRAIKQALPDRTINAIKFKVRTLGIAKRHVRWTDDRVALLTKLAGKISDNEIASILGTTATAVAFRRYELGLTANSKRTAAISRSAVIRDLRDEAQKRGLSLYSITERLGCRQLKPSYDDNRLSLYSVALAAAALGGELYVEWDD